MVFSMKTFMIQTSHPSHNNNNNNNNNNNSCTLNRIKCNKYGQKTLALDIFQRERLGI